jgi:hypothetical protein
MAMNLIVTCKRKKNTQTKLQFISSFLYRYVSPSLLDLPHLGQSLPPLLGVMGRRLKGVGVFTRLWFSL